MNRRNGFTLIETLIATSLAAFLLAIVWAMFDIYTKLEDKGVRASERAAVVRAVQRQLRSDLTQLAPIDPAAPSPVVQDSQTQNPYPSNGYLFGDASSLHLVVHRDAAQETLRAVSYIKRVPESTPQPTPRTNQEPMGEVVSGVMRIDRSWSAFQTDRMVATNDFSKFTAGRKIELQKDDFLFIGADQTSPSNEESFATAPEIRDEIPEIAAWNFRYFDGGRWHDRWDSGWHRRFPLAIEVSFDLSDSKSNLAPSDEPTTELEFERNAEDSNAEHRFVISLGVNSSISTREAQ